MRSMPNTSREDRAAKWGLGVAVGVGCSALRRRADPGSVNAAGAPHRGHFREEAPEDVHRGEEGGGIRADDRLLGGTAEEDPQEVAGTRTAYLAELHDLGRAGERIDGGGRGVLPRPPRPWPRRARAQPPFQRNDRLQVGASDQFTPGLRRGRLGDIDQPRPRRLPRSRRHPSTLLPGPRVSDRSPHREGWWTHGAAPKRRRPRVRRRGPRRQRASRPSRHRRRVGCCSSGRARGHSAKMDATGAPAIVILAKSGKMRPSGVLSQPRGAAPAPCPEELLLLPARARPALGPLPIATRGFPPVRPPSPSPRVSSHPLRSSALGAGRAATALACSRCPQSPRPWLCSVLRGHYRYSGLPSNWHSMNGFCEELRRGWYRTLCRRSQRRLTWTRFQQLLERFPLPSPSITHPRPVHA